MRDTFSGQHNGQQFERQCGRKSGAILQTPSSVGINPASTLTINGGAVTNLGLNGTSTETHNLVVFDNNGILAYGPTGSGQLNVTNFDFRSGLEAWPKFPAAMTTNFSVKSTSGTMAVQSRPNNTGVQGIILTVLAGTMILDYPNPAPNGDSTQGGAKLLPSGPLTLGGGTLFGRFNAGASRTETVLNTIILPGATSFQLTNNAANGNGAYSIVQNALNRNVGGTVDYSTGGRVPAAKPSRPPPPMSTASLAVTPPTREPIGRSALRLPHWLLPAIRPAPTPRRGGQPAM